MSGDFSKDKKLDLEDEGSAFPLIVCIYLTDSVTVH